MFNEKSFEEAAPKVDVIQSNKESAESFNDVMPPNLSAFMSRLFDYLELKQLQDRYQSELAIKKEVLLAAIKAQREVSIHHLDKSFDERKNNFEYLFKIADQAIESNNTEQLAAILSSITEIVKHSPFKQLPNSEQFRQALQNPNHKWQL
ncbi:hypothetical protein [Merismopedia glauca]|uniref:hypothetical protein n=1 Tax=Merismopedia glauca TaxID=292586 RepID=UPI001C63AD6B|nr:hypothetical protein [Merismopedia glauca]